MNRQIVSLILIVTFLLWIIPLGVFIKKSKEKELCFGKRAICLCSQMIAKINKMNRIGMLKSGQGIEQYPSGSSSLSPKFLHQENALTRKQNATDFSSEFNFLYFYLSFKRIEYVPKAAKLTV